MGYSSCRKGSLRSICQEYSRAFAACFCKLAGLGRRSLLTCIKGPELTDTASQITYMYSPPNSLLPTPCAYTHNIHIHTHAVGTGSLFSETWLSGRLSAGYYGCDPCPHGVYRPLKDKSNRQTLALTAYTENWICRQEGKVRRTVSTPWRGTSLALGVRGRCHQTAWHF